MTVNDFAHGYSPPGVYIEEILSPVVGTTGLPPTLVALVGPSIGYQTGSEQFLLTDDPAWRLAKKGVLISSIAVQVISSGVVLTTSDYSTATTASPSSTSDYWTDVTRNTGGALADDAQVFITYRYTDPDFFVPKRFDNYEDVKDAYGEPLNLTSPTLGQTGYEPVSSPLSLAAKIAFENGAGDLVLCAATPPGAGVTTSSGISTARRNALVAAYAKIATNYDVNVVVPLTDDIIQADAGGTGTELAAHVNGSAADGFYRVGILGFDPGVGSAPDTLLSSGGFRSKRLVLAFASATGMSFFSGGAGQLLSLGHQYLAAALAGRLAALPVQKSLTKEVLRSFSGVAGTALSTTTKNAYAAAGVCVVETDRLGQVAVRHGLTTDITILTTRELSVVRARDALVTMFETGFTNSGMIGQPIDTNTALTVKSVASGLLEHAALTGAIVSYTGLAVRQRSIDPTVIEIKFSYLPAYPLNYIVVSFSINVATGVTEELTGATA